MCIHLCACLNSGEDSLIVQASVLHSHVCAISVDGRELGTVSGPNGPTMSPTSRAIPTGVAISSTDTTGSAHWLGLPQFQRSITLIVPLSLLSESSAHLVASDFSPEPASPSLSSIFSLEPHERQKSDIASDAFARSPARFSSGPKVPATTRHKEAAVLVPRHVRSPSVRSSNTKMLSGFRIGAESPTTQELHKISSASVSGRATPEAQTQIQLFLRLRVTAAVEEQTSPKLLDSQRLCIAPLTGRIEVEEEASGEGVRVSGMGPVGVETCLERQPNSTGGFPRLSEVTLSVEGNFLADQTVSHAFSTLKLFETTTSNATETDRYRLDSIKFAFLQPSDTLRFQTVVLKGVSLSWQAVNQKEDFAKQFELIFLAAGKRLQLPSHGGVKD